MCVCVNFLFLFCSKAFYRRLVTIHTVSNWFCKKKEDEENDAYYAFRQGIFIYKNDDHKFLVVVGSSIPSVGGNSNSIGKCK